MLVRSNGKESFEFLDKSEDSNSKQDHRQILMSENLFTSFVDSFCFRISSEEQFPWKYLRKFAFASFVFIAIWPHKSCHERKRVAAKLAKTDFSQTLYLLLFEKCSNKFLVLEFITVYNARFRISFVQFKETLSKNASFTCFCYCFVVVFLLFIH